MDLRLNMLMKNTALRLYKLPKDSQLLIRLGEDWHAPGPNEPPLPTPNSKRAKTNLHDLAARVQANGPRIDPFPDIPAGALSWNGCIQMLPKCNKQEYEGITKTFAESCRIGTTINVHCKGLLSNKDCPDGKQLGAVAVVIYHQGREQSHTKQTFEESVTEADSSHRALKLGLDTLADSLTEQPPHPHTTIILFTSSMSTISKMLDASPYDKQKTSIECMERIDEILHAHPDTDIRLTWLPRATPSASLKGARQVALETIHTAEPAVANELHTIGKQKEKGKADAVDAWAKRWHQSQCTSLAYQTALTRPPDGKPHPTFLAPTKQPQDPPAGEPKQEPQGLGKDWTKKAKFTCKTFTIFYCIIIGHAFVEAYMQRFFPQHTPDQVACQCGEPTQTIEHVLLHCLLFDTSRRKHLMANGHPRNLTQLFKNPERAVKMLRFLEETGACATPRAAWEPG
jgi:hypothetical protein